MHDNKKKMAEGVPDTGIQIIEVRIRNFRSLKSIDVPLNRVTVLIGENNSGKTSFLEALHAAIGGLRLGLTADDIFTTPDEISTPRDRSIIVDVLIRPTNEQQIVVDTFPGGGYWTALFGKGIRQDADDNEFVAIRTVLKWDVYDSIYKVERHFLKEWQKNSENLETVAVDTTDHVSPNQIAPMSLYFMDAKRDIADDMGRQRSIWGQITSELGLPEDVAKEIEKSLSDINSRMLEQSEVLSHLKTNLQILNNLVAGDDEGVKISPVARALRDLAKGIGLDFTSKGSQTFPLARHGMGTKSLAALLVFRAYVSWRIKKIETDKIHPTLALEEPEAHLHPQAQRALFSQITEIPGQTIVSTHSPYIAAQTSIENLRHFGKSSAETTVAILDTKDLEKHDIEKINHLVMNTRGEILFSRAIVLFEGQTEEHFLPILAESWWEKNVHMCGVSFVGVTGAGNYLPFVQMAKMCKIRWYIFADGEPQAIDLLKKHMKTVGIPDPQNEPNIAVLPNGNNLERYLVECGYEDVICEMLNEYHQHSDYVKHYIAKNDGQFEKGGKVKKDYQSKGGRERALADALQNRKVGYAGILANKIVRLSDGKRRYPPQVSLLLKQMSNDLRLPSPSQT